ncbi:ABC transporter ATP-binding protein [Lysobacter sp. CA199]|uniref:ABC transporter ATP-binding protein n=1 Tax=Lysobacter sp. CA199 TaxID=3455608 RepID=UPI003F8D49F5
MTDQSPRADKTVGGVQLRRIAALSRPHIGGILSCLVLILAATAIQLLMPVGIQQLFDRALVGRETGMVHLLAAGLLAILILRSLLSYAGQFRLQAIGDIIIADLRGRLFEHLHTLGLDYHHRQRIGDLLSRLSNDVASVRHIVANLPVFVAINCFQCIGATIVMLSMNWRLGLVVLTMAPLATVLSRIFGPVFERLSTQIQDELARSTTIAQESLSGIEVVSTYARAPYESQRYRGGLRSYLAVVLSMRRTDALYSALTVFLTTFATIVVFWYGGLQVIQGALSAGSLVAFLLYSLNITQSISSLAQHYSSLKQAAGASRRVFELLDVKPDIRDRPGAVELSCEHATVKFIGVDFAYRPGEPVLSDIHLEARAGQTIALVGHSGAGKSTLIKLIPRLYDVAGGAIEVNGRDIRDYTIESLRQAISVVSQDVFLFGASVRDNIRYGRLDASDEDVEAAARVANAHEFIVQMTAGYDTQVGERGLQLSGGQRQRLSIARALLKDAPILLLDEATSAIDNESEALIQSAIDRLKARRTTFVIAHRLATVRNAHQILVMTGGRIVRRPGYDEFIERGAGHAPPSLQPGALRAVDEPEIRFEPTAAVAERKA